MTSLISSEVETQFAVAKLVDPRFTPITRRLRVEGVTDDDELKRLARRALLAQEYFKEYSPPNAPQLPINSESMSELAKTGDFGLAVVSFARSLQLNDWNIDRHPRYQEYMAGLLSLPRLRLPFGAFREPEKLCCYYGAYPLRGLHGNGIWQPDQ